MTREEFEQLAGAGVILLDGATGSNLTKAGMPKGVSTELWVLEHPDILANLQKAYVEAGSQIVYAPTFGANRLKLADYGRENEEDGFFRPVVYLLTKDGVVEYVDVLRCLMFGNAMICQDPIYFANNGVALELCGSEVNLRRKDSSVLELAPLSAEWSAQEIPYSVTGSYNYTSETGWNWLDLGSDGSVQLGVQDNSHIYRGDAAYLGVVPEGVVLGISADETEAGQTSIEFVAAVKTDLYYETLSVTMIDGQNPFAEGETQLQMTRSYG